jgi:LysR family hca operon transcriptional activator
VDIFKQLQVVPIVDVYSNEHRAWRIEGLAVETSLAAASRDDGTVTARSGMSPSPSRGPLKGDVPTVDLVLGYRKSNQSPILKLLLSRLDELVARVSKKIRYNS